MDDMEKEIQGSTYPDTDEPDFIEVVKRAALCDVSNLNCRDIKLLLDHFNTAHKVFTARKEEIAAVLEHKRGALTTAEAILNYKDFENIEKTMERAHSDGVSFFLYGTRRYPEGLCQIPDPPPLLYVKGDYHPGDLVSLAIVGTRKPTGYGRIIASKFAGELAERCITVVSGMARGIDYEAHKAALLTGGRTIAVMGTGPDITYPPENWKLREKIEKSGATITEFPPGTRPLPWRFPARNRIIAALTLGTIVVEAPEKSGALITARLAVEYNREVFAVPGCITSRSSTGCHRLIKDGAKMITSVEDILEEFEMECLPGKISESLENTLTPQEKTIWDLIGDQGEIPEMIIQKSGLLPQTVNSVLLQLELKNMIRRMPDNKFMRLS